MMKVTQEDREAAARIYGAFRDYHNAKAAEDGHLDDGCVVQAFAQHRTTALAAKDEELAAVKAREAKLREVLEGIANNNWRDQSRAKHVARAALSEQQL